MKRKTSNTTQSEVIHKVDERRFAECVNVVFLLSDICEQYILEAQEIIKPVGGEISPDVVNSIERIKIHSRSLVKFVDKHMNEQFTTSFGEVADEVRNFIETVLVEKDEEANDNH